MKPSKSKVVVYRADGTETICDAEKRPATAGESVTANPTNAEVFLANGERLRPEYLVHEAGAKQSIRWAIRG